MFAHLLIPQAPFAIDLSTRPMDVDYTPSRIIGFVFMVMGLGWSGFSLMAFSETGGWFPNLAGACLLSVGLAIFLMLGLRAFVFTRVVTFEQSGVTVRERGLSGVKDWRAAYSEFEGVSLRSFARTHRHSDPVELQIIELIHRSKLSIALKVIRSFDKPITDLEAIARALDLPIIREKDARSVASPDPSLTASS